MRLVLALILWIALCIAALADAGVPYRCGTDTECELLHGTDSMQFIEEDDPFAPGLQT